MDEPSPPDNRALWIMALPLIPVQIGAVLFGGFIAGMTNGPVLLDAISVWMLTAALSTALLARRAGWAQAIGIVAMASFLGLGGIALLAVLGAAIFFGLLVALCGR